MGSLVEYILILGVYFLLLQMTWCTMGTVRTAFILPWMRTKPWGMVLLSNPLCFAFAGMTVALACIWTKCDVDVKLLCFHYLNLVCNNYVNSDVCEKICELWYNMWLVMLNHVWSWFVCWFVWDPSWFHRTIRFIWAQVWRFDRFSDCYCTCAHINWMVLLLLASEQGSTLNWLYGYLKQRFCFIKLVWQLTAIYRCVKNLNF